MLLSNVNEKINILLKKKDLSAGLRVTLDNLKKLLTASEDGKNIHEFKLAIHYIESAASKNDSLFSFFSKKKALGSTFDDNIGIHTALLNYITDKELDLPEALNKSDFATLKDIYQDLMQLNLHNLDIMWDFTYPIDNGEVKHTSIEAFQAKHTAPSTDKVYHDYQRNVKIQNKNITNENDIDIAIKKLVSESNYSENLDNKMQENVNNNSQIDNIEIAKKQLLEEWLLTTGGQHLIEPINKMVHGGEFSEKIQDIAIKGYSFNKMNWYIGENGKIFMECDFNVNTLSINEDKNNFILTKKNKIEIEDYIKNPNEEKANPLLRFSYKIKLDVENENGNLKVVPKFTELRTISYSNLLKSPQAKYAQQTISNNNNNQIEKIKP